MVPRAPSATALSTSWPERMPPSIHTSMREPTASAMAGSALMEETAPSSWRPPWLLTIRASAPLSAARRASSASRMPLRISLPPQRRLIHSTSSQLRRGSNCSAVQDDSDDRSVTPLAWPTMLPKVRRRVPSMPRHQRGLNARSIRLRSVGLGGADKPFLMSLWRWPRICRSSVSTSAEHPAALARSIRLPTNSRSRMT
ncbi:Uncharacterised protein [Bordetella pertussis]|nr:Uncharacterised protein [Bordetella pertussis]